MLVFGQVQAVVYHAEVNRLCIRGALGNDNAVGFQRACLQVAQPSPRQQVVIDIELVVRREQDIITATDGAVLIGIV